MFEKYLIIIPIAAFALFTSIGLVNNYRTITMSTTCASCPDNLPNCSQPSNYVLGGLDVIPYFYNETYKGERGDNAIYTTYNGFTYLFTTIENKAFFDTNPEQYQPQYGGYCAWGVAGEFCPDYPWSVECLGPSGNWQHGTILSQKLYFFLYDEAKEKFMTNIETNIETGDERWLQWFSTIDEKMNTDCYIT
jgi:YHS domain-containing protein